MGTATETISSLALLIEEWRGDERVLDLTRELTAELAQGTEPFVGRPLPADMVRGRLPASIESAWVFVLRARRRNPAHVHPNSSQYTAVIGGGGRYSSGDEWLELEPFDLSSVGRTLLVFPAGTAHSFEPGAEPLAVLSFHTVAPEALVEIEVESRASRRYVEPRS